MFDEENDEVYLCGDVMQSSSKCVCTVGYVCSLLVLLECYSP
jgi:hypothetical protein